MGLYDLLRCVVIVLYLICCRKVFLRFEVLQPAGSAVSEQYKNIERRNLIEPRKKNNYQRRYQKKVIERPDLIQP